jgi:sec-independent protein translocase protein TatA
MQTLPLALLNNLMGMDGLIILVLGLLFFGRRLPEVGKNLGKTIVEFKKGLSGSYSDKEKETPAASEEAPTEEQPAPKRLASSTRVSATPVRKRLAETEEV